MGKKGGKKVPIYIIVGVAIVYLLGIPVSEGMITGGRKPTYHDICWGVLWPMLIALYVIVVVAEELWKLAKAIVQGLYRLGVWIGDHLP